MSEGLDEKVIPCFLQVCPCPKHAVVRTGLRTKERRGFVVVKITRASPCAPGHPNLIVSAIGC